MRPQGQWQDVMDQLRIVLPELQAALIRSARTLPSTAGLASADPNGEHGGPGVEDEVVP